MLPDLKLPVSAPGCLLPVEDVSVRRALLLCLGQFDSQELPDGLREMLVPKLLDLYRTHPDAGLHAAAEWLLRRWEENETLADLRSPTNSGSSPCMGTCGRGATTNPTDMGKRRQTGEMGKL